MEDDEEEFVILVARDGEFLQSAPSTNGFFVEWRDGCSERHFVAKSGESAEEPLTMHDALRLALDFLHAAEWPENAAWARVQL